ncbi:response regulator transcription factor [Microbacterium koreense]|uniref:Response regulator transcription factor n=1 Tax=Microbacterium koreense TaxID=323761 RepID=A0ABW2ZT33_9MICO
MELSDADAQAVLRVAGRLTQHPPLDFAEVLAAVREEIECDSASFNDMVMASRDFRYVMVPATDSARAARLKPHYDAYFHEHPLIAAATNTSGLGAIRFCDVDGSDVTSTDLFRQFYGPLNVRFQLVVQLPSPPDVVVGYALNRSEMAGEFSDRDVAVLNALSGHLAMHHRAALDIERTRLVNAELDRHAWAVVSVRSDRMIEASSSELLPAGVRVPEALKPLVGGDTSRRDVTLGTQQWECIAHPIPFGPTVLFLRRRHDTEEDTARLIAAGLTPRQAQTLLVLAGTGGSNSELAADLGVSEATVKKHLESVFRVLSVTSRTAAIGRLRELTETSAP